MVRCGVLRRRRRTVGTGKWRLAMPSSSRTTCRCRRRSLAAPTARPCGTECRSEGSVTTSDDAMRCGQWLAPMSPSCRPAQAAVQCLTNTYKYVRPRNTHVENAPDGEDGRIADGQTDERQTDALLLLPDAANVTYKLESPRSCIQMECNKITPLYCLRTTTS